MPYAEIEPFWSIVVRWLFFCCLNFEFSGTQKYCEQVIIDENQLSHYNNIHALELVTKLQITLILITNEKDILFEYHSRQ